MAPPRALWQWMNLILTIVMIPAALMGKWEEFYVMFILSWYAEWKIKNDYNKDGSPIE